MAERSVRLRPAQEMYATGSPSRDDAQIDSSVSRCPRTEPPDVGRGQRSDSSAVRNCSRVGDPAGPLEAADVADALDALAEDGQIATLDEVVEASLRDSSASAMIASTMVAAGWMLLIRPTPLPAQTTRRVRSSAATASA